ncbi:MAG: hypothetical protein IKE03_04720, partial [Blautia sp.]|nr:hypothetical protein [Blautia sp.]
KSVIIGCILRMEGWMSQGTCPLDSFEATNAYDEKIEAQLPENKSQGDRFFDSLGESRDLFP